VSVSTSPGQRTRGPRRRHQPEVYRRRRLIAAGAGLLVLAAVILAGQWFLARTSGGPLTPTGAGRMTPAAAQTWIVRPGDTLWSIATASDPTGDVRPLVARLVAETGSASVYPGERVAVP
jgi:hypothetical protein